MHSKVFRSLTGLHDLIEVSGRDARAGARPWWNAAGDGRAKSKNSSQHNQVRKAHRNGIKKPKTNKYPSLRGVDPKFVRNQRYAKHASTIVARENIPELESADPNVDPRFACTPNIRETLDENKNCDDLTYEQLVTRSKMQTDEDDEKLQSTMRTEPYDGKRGQSD
ncbi:ribosomal protein L29 [Pseudozyma hubeiensis SY62]|uniref:60S ribosomal protein L29 n=1 Tax=Pseudozyma hubeiensis (strain SY62) TaxID=1305764 RepID=R9P4W6_PSEHS|nr:ribosomal protein L29 [Pseudozyma hubeiensis SY62]GAC96483.1 ribosomal protein L29 [Pseudozyma hubeiensis SY62]